MLWHLLVCHVLAALNDPTTASGTACRVLQTVLTQLLIPLYFPLSVRRSNLTGILSDGRTNLAKVVPVPELQEMDALMTATVRAQLDLLDQAATAVNDGPGAQVRGRAASILLSTRAGAHVGS